MDKKGTTCKKCKRFVWEEDVGKERLCCFCKPESARSEPGAVYGKGTGKLKMVKRSRAKEEKEERGDGF
jgi:hypothetical protein